MENVVRELRRDFTAAISSDQNDVTLDPSIAKLSEKISDPGAVLDLLKKSAPQNG
jgi:hypothetical protein